MNTESFVYRHIGISDSDLTSMLETIGVASLEELIVQTVPEKIRLEKQLEIPEAISEHAFLKHMEGLAAKNSVYRSYIGLGYHESITPSVIKRGILENTSWYTAYTPYQAEIAQGRLEALLNFQTVISDLTGMPVANASLLDEATAAAEAMSMLFAVRDRDQKKSGSVRFFVDDRILPQTLGVLHTRSAPLGIEIVVGNLDSFEPTGEYFGMLVQYPGKYGELSDPKSKIGQAREAGLKIAVAADILSLVLLQAPGEWGVDVVVGSTQRFGIPLGYGGPHAAYFATLEEYKRHLPGRIIGKTLDRDGKEALRMALQTREQHIKRDKATSNICTAQVLLAVMAGMYAVYHGPAGLKDIAGRVHRNTLNLCRILSELGVRVKNEAYFDTLSLSVPDTQIVAQRSEEKKINFNIISETELSISINETVSSEDLCDIVWCITGTEVRSDDPTLTTDPTGDAIPNTLRRTGKLLDFPVFNSYHSETELMRYIKKLERKDLALNHSMISLGSCTMKLNAASEMLPLSWSAWGNIHPFVPTEQAEGYQQVLGELEAYLNEITGMAATSLQPNSGAQGEYSGLMTIRAYHESRGEGHRNICLIPASAHGTNPASAIMAGMKVVVTKTDEKGNIDWEDIKTKTELHSENLAALMVTYPSTHGVFESSIREITDLIHSHGGQVYMDGANMNAQVGLTSPARIGADVCHLNLHKTFSIPHGGGGPGVGPICVAPQLASFLPTNALVPTGGAQAIPGISAAPWGSALACLISYGYIRMLGPDGIRKATEYAILNANYIKERLDGYYPILYTGEEGRAAHELIIDCRPFKEKGIEVVDIAKRLMDYGFHAPTVSFPVPGTMMIEPTESENKQEIDRFCEAMISIRKEIDLVRPEDPNNALKNAPHTLEMVTSDQWTFPYSRKKAAYPLDFVYENKFWPTVRRMDEAYGDRNLMCTCAPTSQYEEEAVEG